MLNDHQTNPRELAIFVSGRRGQLATHSRSLATWMNINNSLLTSYLMTKNSTRPSSWFVGNCWNETVEHLLDHGNGTFMTVRSFWISESVAMMLCRRFRKDLLGNLRELFAREHQATITRQAQFTRVSDRRATHV